MKKIAFYGIPFPEGMAMTNRLKMYLKALKCFNHKTVYCYGKSNKKGIWNETTFYHIKNRILIQKHFDFYFLNAFKNYFFINKIAKEVEVLVVTRASWISLIIISIISKIRKCKIVLEFNENPGSIGKSFLNPFWKRKIERWLFLNITFRLIDGFICISSSLEELALKYKHKNAQIIVIPILCDDSKLNNNDIEQLEKTRRTNPYIFHAGFIDPQKDGIYSVFKAFALACKKTTIPIKFLLTVRLANKNVLYKIDKIIIENKIQDRVEWLGFLTEDEVNKYRENAILGIVNKPHNWQNEFNFPTKLAGLLNSGVPVIASKTGEINKYLEDNKNAYMVEPDDVLQISDKILDILNNRDKAKNIAKNSLLLAENAFHYNNHSLKFEQFFNSLFN